MHFRDGVVIGMAVCAFAVIPLSGQAAPGDLDPAFGTGGKVTTAIGTSWAFAEAVAVQGDGKIVAAGRCEVGSNVDFCVARYKANGSLDSSFDGDGKVITPIGMSRDYAEAVAIQGDGKIVAAGKCVVEGLNFGYGFCLARYASDGSLDNSLDTDGKLLTAFGTGGAHALAIQSDGKIVLGGDCAVGSTIDFCLARYTSDGSLDSSFDTDGKLTTPIGTSNDIASALAIQSDGKIVAAGSCNVVGFGSDFCLARYDGDGSLDGSFDSDGKLTTPIGSSDDYAEALAIQSDGKIVLAGYCGFVGSGFDFCLARYNVDGSLDSSFDSDGKLTTPIGTSSDVANSLAIQSDGKIVAAGSCAGGSGLDFCLARYTTAGSLDSSFDEDGTLTTLIGTSSEAHALAIQDDGKIVAAGNCHAGSSFDFCLARYNSNGSLDSSFDTDGKLTTPIGTGDSAHAVAKQDDGKIVAGGTCNIGATHTVFCLARYNVDGSLDSSFDTDGKLTTAIGTLDRAHALAIQDDGKIVLGGKCSVWPHASGTTPRGGVAPLEGPVLEYLCLARHAKDGSLDSSFDGDGKVLTPIGAADDAARALAIQSDGKIVVAGYCGFVGSGFDFCLARYNVDGSLDSSFDSDGKLTTPIGTSSDVANALAIQSDGKIVAAGSCAGGSGLDFCLARYNVDGSLDSSFDSDGKLTTPIGTSSDVANALAIQDDGKIVAAGNCHAGSSFDFCLARYNSNGSLDSSFHTDGTLTTPIGTSDDHAHALAIQDDGRIVLAGNCVVGSTRDFCVARYNADGSLDSSFDTDGKLTTAVGTGDDVAEGVVVQSDGKVVAGGRCSSGATSLFCLTRYDEVPPGSFGLNVTKDGTGFGSVTGTGISCGSDCFGAYVGGTPVTLTAAAGHGSVFGSWSGCDSPSGSTCTMTMNSAKTVTANFTATPTFADVPPTNAFYEDIEHLFDLGIATGCNPPANDMFCPADSVPRQRMAAFLIRAKGLTQLFPATPSFVDVPASNPFFGYIERLKEQGITTGCNPPANDRFCPADFVPRQQMAAFLIRAKGLTQLFPATPSFTDVPASNPFFGYIERLKQQGITTGCNPPTNDRYCPLENVPRQQMAAFLIRAFAP